MNSKEKKSYILVVSTMVNMLLLSLIFLFQYNHNETIADLEQENIELETELRHTSLQFDNVSQRETILKDQLNMMQAREEASFYLNQHEEN